LEQESDGGEYQETAASSDQRASASAQFAASSKKNGKVKKKKTGGGGRELEEEDDNPGPDPAVSKATLPPTPAWVAGVQAAISGSLLQELLGQRVWNAPEDLHAAEARLAELVERLPWSSPLGLRMPLEWKDFAGLVVDGGPRRTSRRGAPQWVARLQKNIPSLLAHYITLLFLVTALHALSHFGWLLWILTAQAALILAPPEVPYVSVPVRVLLLQGTHLLLWIFFVRSVWLMHLLVKLLLAGLVAGHAYVVAGIGES